jgi:hypothetical protein
MVGLNLEAFPQDVAHPFRNSGLIRALIPICSTPISKLWAYSHSDTNLYTPFVQSSYGYHIFHAFKQINTFKSE